MKLPGQQGWGVVASLLVLAAGACATVQRHERLQLDRLASAPARAAWRALDAGEAQQAESLLRAAVAEDPGDALSALLLGLVARERLRVQEGLGFALAALEAAAPGAAARARGPWHDALAGAALVTLPRLVHEGGDARTEARLLDFQPERLSWYGRLALAALTQDIARRRGDAGLLKEIARRTGCVTRVDRLPRLGRSPLAELLAAPSRSDSAEVTSIPLLASGCRIELPAQDGLWGVERLRAQIEVPAGEYDIAIERDGLAAVRVDGGPWHHHGSIERYGPGRSAVRLPLPAGQHTLELRIPSYGQALAIVVAVMPVRAGEASTTRLPDWLADADWSPAAPDAAEASSVRLVDLLAALLAEARADSEGYGARSARLAAASHNGVALATAAHFALLDPGLPATVARDRARVLYGRAAQLDFVAARSWLALSALASEEGRFRDAERLSARAAVLAPDAPAVQLALYRALSAQGIETAADRALDSARAAIARVPESALACTVYELLAGRAGARARFGEEETWLLRAARCDASSTRWASALRERRRRAEAIAEYRRLAELHAGQGWVTFDLAELLAAQGQLDEALQLVSSYRERFPDDAWAWVRWADLLGLRDGRVASRDALTKALERFPERKEVGDAARAVGLAQSSDALRVDGKAIVDAFLASGRVYAAPAVMVLDRLVERVYETGARHLLVHGIVRVQTKEGIERWGEFHPPAGAEILLLRTRKADGRVLLPESIAGKESISLPELEEGDFVEWETLEGVAPSPAFAPGFVGARFFFQSFDLPLDRSEYWVVYPAALRLEVDRQAGAPAPEEDRLQPGLARMRFSARHVPQLYPERASVGEREFVPSVRVAAAVKLATWARFLDERLAGAARQSPELRAHARRLFANEADPAARIVAWVGKHIEAEGEVDGSATVTLARGRGSRLSLALALARAVGLDARMVLARPLTAAEPSAPASILAFEDFAYPLFAVPPPGTPPGQPWQGSWRHADLRLRHAPLGYLPPGLDGALAIEPATATHGKLASAINDARSVVAEIALDAEGQAQAQVLETLRGLPAFDWAETLSKSEHDEKKLRRDFERGWLAHHFPGARLQTLEVKVDEQDGSKVELRYGFVLPGMAEVDAEAGELVLVPRFFRADLGRRFASESRRTSPLFLGYDVPLQLDAILTFPLGSTVVAAGTDGAEAWTTSSALGAGEFREERRVLRIDARVGGGGPGVQVRRALALPLARVPVADYAALARKLRETEPLESAPIRVRLPGGAP